MGFTILNRYGTTRQYLIGLALVFTAAVSCFFAVEYIGYRVVALVLLLVVSILAMIFDILPVLFIAVISALTWNYFFIPPIYRFHIGTTEDVLMFSMYFVIALVNAVLTFKIRQYENKFRLEQEHEKSIEMYNTLLNSLSHELRTPISAIIGSVDAIKDNNGRITEENRNHLITEIEIAGLRLNRQVENLLSMSRLEAGFLHPKLDWVDLNELVHHIVEKFRYDNVNHTIEFKEDQNLPLFKTDQGLLEHILHNLLHNSLQYTREQSIITIVTKQFSEGFQIIISDNGNGFPEDELEAVFNKFYRLPGSSSGGTGLGLSIVKGFTEALGGNVKLDNIKSGGARFCIEIPSASSTIVTQTDER